MDKKRKSRVVPRFHLIHFFCLFFFFFGELDLIQFECENERPAFRNATISNANVRFITDDVAMVTMNIIEQVVIDSDERDEAPPLHSSVYCQTAIWLHDVDDQWRLQHLHRS